jgi:hypothetical protein
MPYSVERNMSRPPREIDYSGPLLDFVPPQPRTARPALDEPSLDRILASVGQEFIPADLNRTALLSDIEEAALQIEKIDRIRTGRRAQANAKIMKVIRERAEELLKLLKENDDINYLIWDADPSACRDLTRLVGAAEHYEQIISRWEKEASEIYSRIPSARDWLSGLELPLIFEEYFHRKAGRSRIDGKPDGPTVRFVAAAMLEMERPFKRESIIRAMTRYAEARERRRVVRDANRGLGAKPT